MAVSKSKRMKTETLSLRLDPKTRFILEFISRIRGQSITVVVERAIKEAADAVVIGPATDFGGNDAHQASWSDFWDADEGIRTLRLLANSHYITTYEEDEIRRFTLDHHEFFYDDRAGQSVRRTYIGLLWSKMEQYIEVWQSTRNEDYWAAGKQMAEDLRKAGLSAPAWPRPATKKPAPSANFNRELDDEVPF